ncbi:helix-turn-helix transcriptional regulator [Pseudoalteromonas xiamenensis]|uniref:helix-turn-helix domain-containing protein n=1 Tax=Pseudoalteromonas xiamenensis TaxID=882626 RepID=UPI0027E497C0|nr:helix-turn-helix transcriptional regulator [Pseudoalteromonas xiamenensis]WMN60670.1 helix-turn-helix transcriptional regulator [Pseudoalteromonas xiamenensis]WMN60767.1 helix-turn-helix transcriptional regulator [Pseudoalteromonas xiamenensis]
MSQSNLYMLLLVVAIALLLTQISIKQKRTMHVLFAVFCGSVAMVALKKITGEQIGAYQYLIGMTTCATCNVYWLLSRCLFREKSPIALPHLIMAASIACLVMFNQGYLFVSNLYDIQFSSSFTHHFLGELIGLLSSCILVLMIWEGFRGFQQANKLEKKQRTFYLVTIMGAIGLSTVSNSLFVDDPAATDWSVGLITLTVLINTQVLVYWRRRSSLASKTTLSVTHDEAEESKNRSLTLIEKEEENDFAKAILALIVDEQRFLQANLKVVDIARELNVSEYRISKALRNQLNAKNFNDFVNRLRIEHASSLLLDPDKQHWSILVVGLESGFASVGPFTRAFKSHTGFTPNQYRLSHQASSEEEADLHIQTP